MQTFSLSGIVLGLACVAVTAAPAPPEKDYQKIADKEEWKWDKEQASVFYSQKHYDGKYEIELQKPPRWDFAAVNIHMVVRFKDDDKDVYCWSGHDGTVFAVRQEVVYYADYAPYSSGCAVVAYDLQAKKTLWRTNLKGLGPIDHSKYGNAVILDIKEDAVHILGNEPAGRYVEYLDLKTGKTVGHKVFNQKQKD
jgi:hypothetical protein